MDSNPKLCSPKSDALTPRHEIGLVGVTFLIIRQASWATCCEFATGLHIDGSRICALLEMCAETFSDTVEMLVSLHSYEKYSQAPEKYTHEAH